MTNSLAGNSNPHKSQVWKRTIITKKPRDSHGPILGESGADSSSYQEGRTDRKAFKERNSNRQDARGTAPSQEVSKGDRLASHKAVDDEAPGRSKIGPDGRDSTKSHRGPSQPKNMHIPGGPMQKGKGKQTEGPKKLFTNPKLTGGDIGGTSVRAWKRKAREPSKSSLPSNEEDHTASKSLKTKARVIQGQRRRRGGKNRTQTF